MKLSNNFTRIIISFIFAPIIIFAIYKGETFFNFLLLLIIIFAIKEIIPLKNYNIKFTILIFLFFFILFSYNIRNLYNGRDHFFLIVIITWLSDIGGYCFGKFIGGKKINVLSPNKTYSGFVGAVLLPLISLIYILLIPDLIFKNIFFTLIILLSCSLIVILGDLLFSFFKRVCMIKDYSNLIPGHGGIFDRIDGMILLVIYYFILLKLI